MMVATLKKIAKRASKVFGSVALSGDRYWPTGVLSKLETEYHLKPDDMLRLGYLRRRYGKKDYHYSLYIYDKMAATNKSLKVRNVKDIYYAPELLLYRGSISSDGTVRIVRAGGFEHN